MHSVGKRRMAVSERYSRFTFPSWKGRMRDTGNGRQHCEVCTIRNSAGIIRPYLHRWLAIFLMIAVTMIPAPLDSACAQDPEIRFGSAVPPDVELIYERGLQWLVKNQDKDGTWHGGENHHGGGAGNSGITGMAVMAFLASGETAILD